MRLDFSNISQEISRHLPLLDLFVAQHADQRPLEGVDFLLIQHQLGNHYPQVRALLDLGIEPSRITWIDVPYSSRPQVRQAMINELRIPADRFRVHSFQILDHYPSAQLRRVQEVLHDFLMSPPERLVVLDDGAYFLEAAACFAKQLPACAVVEQTTRGLIKIEESAALRRRAKNLPIVNVARSKPKQTLEPPFIGRAVCASLSRHLGSVPSGRQVRCLVLGFGAIGRQVAEFLPATLGCDRAQVHVHDQLGDRVVAATRAGFSHWDRDDVSHRFHVVVGCSGRRSFRLDDGDHLEDGAVLATASSGTVELSRQDFIELAEASEFDDIWVVRDGLNEANVHSDLRIHLIDRTVTFVNGGFPVNFDGRVNCIPGRYIQPTPTMMVAGAVQAVEEMRKGSTGIIPLDPDFCAWVDAAFRQELGSESDLLG